MGWLMDEELARRARKARAREQAATADAAANERMAQLFGLDADPDERPNPNLDVVGWMQRAPGTVIGVNHRCITCQPARPGRGYWEPVERMRLAARQPCVVCAVVLETVALP